MSVVPHCIKPPKWLIIAAGVILSCFAIMAMFGCCQNHTAVFRNAREAKLHEQGVKEGIALSLRVMNNHDNVSDAEFVLEGMMTVEEMKK